MINLEKQSGLPLSWDSGVKRLVFGENMANIIPQYYRKGDIKDVLFEPDEEGPDYLYAVYRGSSLKEDLSEVERQGIRYDITVISPGAVGREYIKTAGQYHPLKPGTLLTFPEVYEVLHGRAHFLLQRPNEDDSSELDQVILINARPGDKVLICPGFGHVIINPGEDYLIMSNWVGEDLIPNNIPILEKRGGGYYELKDEEGPIFLPNSNYTHLPSLKRCPVVSAPKLRLKTGLPVYQVFKDDPVAFSFLLYPENYQDVFCEYIREMLDE